MTVTNAACDKRLEHAYSSIEQLDRFKMMDAPLTNIGNPFLNGEQCSFYIAVGQLS